MKKTKKLILLSLLFLIFSLFAILFLASCSEGNPPPGVGLEDIINSLFPNPWIFATQIVAIIVLTIFTVWFIWTPAKKMIEKRRELVLKEVNEIKKIKETSLELKKEIEDKEISTKIKANKIVNLANEKAHFNKKNVEQAAKENSKRILNETDIIVAKKIRDSEKYIKDKIIDIAFATAEELSKKNISKDDNKKLVDDFISSLDKELSNEK